jgi:phosphomevalonate kinase
MNERIKEIAEQAREYATTRHQVSNIVLSINNDKFEQKFAELIVKETMQVVANQLPSNQYLDVAHAVIEHFGAEE